MRPISIALFISLLAACGEARGPTASRPGATTSAPIAGAASGAGAAAISGSAGAKSPGDSQGQLLVGAGSGGTVAPIADNCSAAAKLIYTVDQDGRFSSFDPSTTPPSFKDITSRLSCPAKNDIFGIPQTPYSMSVDRNAVAWVLYSSGELFRVETLDGSCKSTTFQANQAGFMLMGMGFVADSPMSNVDTLFVAGGGGPNSGTGSKLGTVDMRALTIAPAQQLTGWPELTGTGLAELWGFYPDTTPPKVARINKQTGVEEMVYPLASLQGQGAPAAWAFAFWGGDFYLFLMRTDDPDTTVYKLDHKSGELGVALSGTGRRIVGAGVSTCAPVELL